MQFRTGKVVTRRTRDVSRRVVSTRRDTHNTCLSRARSNARSISANAALTRCYGLCVTLKSLLDCLRKTSSTWFRVKFIWMKSEVYRGKWQ